jgi:nucleoside-diphosphate-sugar epimerase/pimeloyl-ACP methyl ester carboxylesterase
MQNVLITGATGFLGSYIAIEYLSRTASRVFCLARTGKGRGARERLLDRLTRSLRDSGYTLLEAEEQLSAWDSRIHVIDGSLTATSLAPTDLSSAEQTATALTSALPLASALPRELEQVWHVAGAMNFAERYRPLVQSVNVEGTCSLLAALSTSTVSAFNYVSTAYVAGVATGLILEVPSTELLGPVNNPYESSKRDAEALVQQSDRFRSRIFRPSIVVGDSRTNHAWSNVGLYGFLSMVDRVHGDISDRIPRYFEQHPLRLMMAEGVGLNMIPVDRAARCMFEIAALSASSGVYHIAATASIAADRVCDLITQVYGFDVRAAHSPDQMNPIDWVLQKKVADFDCYLKYHKDFSLERMVDAWPNASRVATLSEQECEALIRAHRAEQVSRAPDSQGQLSRIERVEIAHGGTEAVTLFRGKAGGPKVFILNAFGQSPVFWNPLLEVWGEQYETILMQPRGIAGDFPAGLTFDDQVADLKAILDREDEMAPVHLVGWCTAPKVLLEYTRQNPGRVASLCFVTGAFYGFAGTEDLATSYERTMEPLCRRVLKRPELARFVMDALSALLVGKPESDSVERLEISELLSFVSKAVKPLVIAPFLREASLLNYAAQLLDFWSVDLSRVAAAVTTPTLFIASERDKIASPEMSYAVSRTMPNAHFVNLRGGNHYCMYESHELVAELLSAFWTNPADLRRFDGDVRFDATSVCGELA